MNISVCPRKGEHQVLIRIEKSWLIAEYRSTALGDVNANIGPSIALIASTRLLTQSGNRIGLSKEELPYSTVRKVGRCRQLKRYIAYGDIFQRMTAYRWAATRVWPARIIISRFVSLVKSSSTPGERKFLLTTSIQLQATFVTSSRPSTPFRNTTKGNAISLSTTPTRWLSRATSSSYTSSSVLDPQSKKQPNSPHI